MTPKGSADFMCLQYRHVHFRMALAIGISATTPPYLGGFVNAILIDVGANGLRLGRFADF